MQPKLTLAASFSTEPQANIAQGMLEDNGIQSYLETNNMATLYGAGSTWAPLKLYVAVSDLEKALHLLQEHGDI